MSSTVIYCQKGSLNIEIFILENRYQKLYYKITQRGQSRIKQKGMHAHHIIPLSCGGSNVLSNITYLTRKEHRLCHKLLLKFIQSDYNKI